MKLRRRADMAEKQEEKREMMIIEGMKRLRVIKKRMANNIESVNKYAAIVSNERPMFGSEDEQKKEVKQIIQSNLDLLKEYLKLKKRIERTNLQTVVEIGGVNYTISDLLILKRELVQLVVQTYDALNTNQAQMKLNALSRQHHVAGQQGESLRIDHMFDEKEKNKELRKWQDLYDNIDSRLEVINATTPLQD
jgi:hypothetical protein